MKKAINNKKKAFELLRGLDHSAAAYSMLREPTDPTWNAEEKQALEQLQIFGVLQPFPMLLSCFDRFFETDRPGFAKILKAASVIAFRYNVICGQHPGHQETLYNDVAVKVSEGEYAKPRQVVEAMKHVYPSDQQFKAAFAEKKLKRNRKIMRHILFRIEKQLSGMELDEESDNVTLEHILPESPSEEWAHIPESVQEEMVYRIGNITLLERGKNRDVGNVGYAVKRDAYANSRFHLTKAIAEHYDEWNERKLAARQKKLADVACAVWRMDF
jgi:hypothetical protein